MDHIFENNENSIECLVRFLSKKYSGYSDFIKYFVNLGNHLTKSEFGLFCSIDKRILKILYSSRNPYLLTGDSYSMDTFIRYNILTGINETEILKVRNGTLLNREILFQSEDNLFCISSPLFISKKIFGYFIFFKEEEAYPDSYISILDNLLLYASSQFDNLINYQPSFSEKENNKRAEEIENESELDINKYIKSDSLNKSLKEMETSDEVILDMNMIQNLRDLGGDEDTSFLKEVIELYLSQAPGLMNDMRAAANGNNPLKLSQSSHALKGASLNIGAKKFSDICKILELRGRNNEMDGLDILLKDMDKYFTVTSNELKKLID